uniref:Uncharacterized protein n=1 Tax=Heterorhabditis bacteriophora TaxID=37862 RepID=A0A1I7X4A3_HETBA
MLLEMMLSDRRITRGTSPPHSAHARMDSDTDENTRSHSPITQSESSPLIRSSDVVLDIEDLEDEKS